MSQQYFVAKGQSLKLPNTNVTWTVCPRTGRRMKQGTSGGWARSGTQLSQDFVDFAKNKKESNGQTLLQNLIDSGAVVFNQGDSSPLEQFAKALPVERTLDPNTPRSRPSRD